MNYTYLIKRQFNNKTYKRTENYYQAKKKLDDKILLIPDLHHILELFLLHIILIFDSYFICMLKRRFMW